MQTKGWRRTWSQGGGWYDMWNYVNDATGYRVINTGLIPITDKFSINHVLTWAPLTTSSPDYTNKTRLLSLVARGQYQFTEYVRLIGEVGGFTRKTAIRTIPTTNKPARNTPLVGLADGPDFMSRPELRILPPISMIPRMVNRLKIKTASNTWNFGVQVEALVVTYFCYSKLLSPTV